MRPASLLPVLVMVAACAQTGGEKYRPAAQTNDAAMSNISVGVEYMRRGEYEKALDKLERAQKADPSYPLTYNSLGVLYELLGDDGMAEKNFKRALQLDRSNSATLNNYGRLLCKNGRVKEAEDMFRRAAKNPLYETPEIPVTNAGLCLKGAGRVDDAEDYFRRALQYNPRQPTALLQMSRLSYDRGEYMSGRGYLQRYLAEAAPTAESLWLGIQIEQQLGDKDTVSSYALLLRNNFPESDEARKLRDSGIR